MPSGETAYTRAGNFSTNDQGQMVTEDGYTVQPAHHRSRRTPPRPPSARPARCSVDLEGQVEPQTVGQIELANFINEAGLEAIGDNLFMETAASGAANGRRPRPARLRHPAAGLHRSLERRRGQRNHRPDRRPARLRDELQGHQDGGRDAPGHLEPAVVSS
jgi:hypothetical protein